MHIRLPDTTRAELHDYAQAHGITDTAAAAVLIRRGLTAARKDTR